jgi:hypothetical protein
MFFIFLKHTNIAISHNATVIIKVVLVLTMFEEYFLWISLSWAFFPPGLRLPIKKAHSGGRELPSARMGSGNSEEMRYEVRKRANA